MAWWADEASQYDLDQLKITRRPEWQPELELLAILVSLRLRVDKFTCGGLVVHGDAKAALHAAKKLASPSPAMNDLAGKVGVAVEVFSINLVVKHLPGAVNVDADAISRLKRQIYTPGLESCAAQRGASERRFRVKDGSTWRGRSGHQLLQYLSIVLS